MFLDLTGSDLIFSTAETNVGAGCKPFEGMTGLPSLSLSCFGPFTGNWKYLASWDGLCAMGMTSLTNVVFLNLSGNKLES